MPQPFDPQALLQDADPEIPGLLARCPDLVPLRYRDGEFLVREGEEDQDLFVILSGSLVVERGGPPPATLAHLLCDPSAPVIVGEMAYFGDTRRTASVRTVGATVALRLAPRHVDALVASSPGLTRLLLRQLTRRLRDSNEALQGFQSRFRLDPRQVAAAEGEVLFTRGDPAGTLFQLLSGSVRVQGEGPGRVLEGSDLPDGFLGLEAFLGARPHPVTATAASPCFLVAVDAARREDFLRCYPALALRVLEGG